MSSKIEKTAKKILICICYIGAMLAMLHDAAGGNVVTSIFLCVGGFLSAFCGFMAATLLFNDHYRNIFQWVFPILFPALFWILWRVM